MVILWLLALVSYATVIEVFASASMASLMDRISAWSFAVFFFL